MASRSDCFDRHVENKDPQKSERVMQAMLQMQKIDINKLKEA
ncbi:MAG: hypothetical protein WAN04_14655 [Candidatus Udaeobacter sp.]